MNDKYYTPTINEFYVGFEYERCDDGYKYFKDIYPRSVDQNKLENYLPYFRVKYLDKTDIERLGFEDIHKGTDRGNTDRCYKYQLRKVTSNKYEPIPTYKILCNLHYYPDKPGIIYIGGLCDFKIKNKSELVKLLKMLGINE